MVRATRSKKVEVSEDQSATVVADLTQSSFAPIPLNEIDSSNAMAPIQDALTAELKGLKAAYRTAIGAGRKGTKRGRKQKMQDLRTELDEHFQEAPADLDAHPQNMMLSAEAAKTSAAHIEQEGSRLAVNTTPIPERRTTRRQAAKAQVAERQQQRSQIDIPCVDHRTDPSKGVKTAEQTAIFPAVVSAQSLASPSVEAIAENAPESSTIKSPIKTLDEIEMSRPLDGLAATETIDDDSFVEQIITRSPAKPASRIEDSVEALDKLEEALEALDAATLAEKLVSPEKPRQQSLVSVPIEGKALFHKALPSSETSSRSPSVRSESVRGGFSSMRVKSTATKAPLLKKAASMTFRAGSPHGADSRPSPNPTVASSRRPLSMIVGTPRPDKEALEITAQRAAARRPVSLIAPKETVRSSKPVTQSSFELPGEAVARRLKEQREARQARREANEASIQINRTNSVPKIRSTKPPTVSNFELPSEALSRRKRDAQAAKIKAQEEEERRRRDFKAKPVPKVIAPSFVPRDTVASRARQSKIGTENTIDNSNIKRNSVISNVGSHRPSLAALVAANTSAPRAPGPAQQLSRMPSSSSANGTVTKVVQRSVSASDFQIQRQRAKEIYNRDAKLTEEIERERREREAAAKRAREEAAERGRQASREWAEKQMARKLFESKGSTPTMMA